MASSGKKSGRRVDYQAVDEGYLKHRTLKRGAAGWILLAGLGVSYVISGDFAGWNFGLAEGGWGGLLIATVLMGLMYTCMVFGLAEMSSALPVAGAGYGFARRALGPLGGFATGMAVLIEYAVAPAAIASFIGGYVQALGLLGGVSLWFDLPRGPTSVFIGVHLYGVGEALKLMFGITAIAMVALIATVVGLAPKFSVDRLLDIDPDGSTMSSSFLPFGISGVVAALVYGIWFFLAVEGVPLAAEETDDPARDMPRGIIGGMLVLLVTAFLILFIVPGAAGSSTIADSDNPLPAAIREALGGDSPAGRLRQLRRTGRPDRQLLLHHLRLLAPAVRAVAGRLPAQGTVADQRAQHALGGAHRARHDRLRQLLAAITEDGALLINIAVFGATVSYVLLNLSHIVLRRKEPDLERPYRTPGGTVTTGVALVLSVIAVIATFFVDEKAAVITALVFAPRWPTSGSTAATTWSPRRPRRSSPRSRTRSPTCADRPPPPCNAGLWTPPTA